MRFWELYTKYYDLVDLLMRYRIPVYTGAALAVSLVLLLYNPAYRVLFQAAGYLFLAVLAVITGLQLLGVLYQAYMLLQVGRRWDGAKILLALAGAVAASVMATLLIMTYM